MSSIKIDKNSIAQKCAAFFPSKEGQQKIKEAGRQTIKGLSKNMSLHTPEETADKFAYVLRTAMNNSGLSANAIESIGDIDYSVHQISDTVYEIRVYFSGDLTRPSLQPEKYGGIDDIVLLLNNGVDHTMHPVKGEWHGKEIYNRTVIPGLHFLEQAVTDFKGNYSTEYNVIDIYIEK